MKHHLLETTDAGNGVGDSVGSSNAAFGVGVLDASESWVHLILEGKSIPRDKSLACGWPPSILCRQTRTSRRSGSMSFIVPIVLIN